MNTNERYGSSLDRTLGAGKPVDPATRLSELLAQSLEELTRPFDPPRPGPARATPRMPSGPRKGRRPSSRRKNPASTPTRRWPSWKPNCSPPPSRSTARRPRSRRKRRPSIPRNRRRSSPRRLTEAEAEKAADAPNEADIAPPPLVPEEPETKHDADAAGVIAKVRKLMLVSMAVTVIAVGSVFGFIGYRIFKGEGTTAKTADKLPPASAIPADITLSLPRGARVIQAGVAADRLVITLEIDGKIEVRTFDVTTLQPAGRINFSGTP